MEQFREIKRHYNNVGHYVHQNLDVIAFNMTISYMVESAKYGLTKKCLEVKEVQNRIKI